MTQFPVDPGMAGRRLDVVVAGAQAWSRSRAERAIDQGLIQVNGLIQPRRYLVRAGETITIAEEPSPDINPPKVPILYEDDDILVLDKPAGVLTHPGSHHTEGTIADFTRRLVQDEDDTRPGIVHRLDRDTSGVLIVAKTPSAKTYLQKLFHDRQVTKTYLALAVGRMNQDEAIIELPLARSPRRQTRQAVDTTGRSAITYYLVQAEYPGFSLLEVQPRTGRTHQIRAHLQAIGHPIAGDRLYGAPAVPEGLRRQFLHASRLEFIGPSGQEVDVHSPLPPDLQAVLDHLD